MRLLGCRIAARFCAHSGAIPTCVLYMRSQCSNRLRLFSSARSRSRRCVIAVKLSPLGPLSAPLGTGLPRSRLPLSTFSPVFGSIPKAAQAFRYCNSSCVLKPVANRIFARALNALNDIDAGWQLVSSLLQILVKRLSADPALTGNLCLAYAGCDPLTKLCYLLW